MKILPPLPSDLAVIAEMRVPTHEYHVFGPFVVGECVWAGEQAMEIVALVREPGEGYVLTLVAHYRGGIQ